MIAREHLQKFGLRYNPFPPGATGEPSMGTQLIPGAWAQKLHSQFDQCINNDRPRVMVINGPPGSGKSTLLRWMAENLYRPEGIRTCILTNPSMNFYHLADQIIEQAGSFELTKGMWELLKSDIGATGELTGWLEEIWDRDLVNQAAECVKQAILKQEITQSPEVAEVFAKTLLETYKQPQYRFKALDIANNPWVGQESIKPFRCLVRMLQRIGGDTGVAILVDDFPDLTMGRRLIRKDASNYYLTMQNLRRLTITGDLWLATARSNTTHISAPETNGETDGEHNQEEFSIPPLTDQNAHDLIQHLIRDARSSENPGGFWPFKNKAVLAVEQHNRNNPRSLVRTFSQALEKAALNGEKPPISNQTIWNAQEFAKDFREPEAQAPEGQHPS